MSHCIIVDAMHNLFLGLIKEHFDGILGIRLSKAEEVPVVTIKFSTSLEGFSPPEQKSISKLEKWLAGPMAADLVANRQQVEKKFMRCHVRALEFACAELKCPMESLNPHKISKIGWVQALLAWVSVLTIFILFFLNMPQ
jgi:hypothetical protein